MDRFKVNKVNLKSLPNIMQKTSINNSIEKENGDIFDC